MARGEPFTFGQLWREHSSWTGDGLDPYREADRCIQRWRKRGWIEFRREGRDTVWMLTDAGRKALANG